jgi:hypothetical protein
MRLVLSLSALSALSLGVASAPPRGPRYEHVFTLRPKEGVFAYARISPDGKRLAYASQISARPSAQRSWSVTAVDLTTQKTLFTENGIDAYWSADGARLVYSGTGGVTIRNVLTNVSSAYPEASGLGDYFSWAVRDGKDLIMTIQSNYYYLGEGGPVLPHTKVTKCDEIGGTGERPLISHDGKRISTFVKGILVVRALDNCAGIVNTHIQGSKADFSWDGRYIAFHAVKSAGTGYEIRIVDLQKKTVRTLPNLQGSALFPSWTKDGRLCFRYDGPDYRGFLMASNVLDTPEAPLPTATEALPDERRWEDIFPETPPVKGLRLVMIWAPWSAHSLEAFTNLQEARDHFVSRGMQVDAVAAADPGSRESDIASQLEDFRVTIPRIPLSQRHLAMTEARNQMPTMLLFRDGALIDRKLGAQSFETLRDWVLDAAEKK